MYKITRRFEFEAAHRLLGHEGRCRFLHGHSYVAEISLMSRSLSSLNMVLDFRLIKEGVGEWIDRNWDHNILLTRQDPLWDFMPDVNDGRLPFSFGESLPTAEMMARVLFEFAELIEPIKAWGRVTIEKVRVQETSNCWAEYDGSE